MREDDLDLVELETSNGLFATGEPVAFRYMRSTEKSPYLGARFGQDIEPAGVYLLQDDSDAAEHPVRGWEYGVASFQSPLVLSFTLEPDEPHYGPYGWKARLSRAFGRKGKALSRALSRAGYDGIVTVWVQSGRPSYTKEIVDLTFGRALEPDVEGP